MAKKPTIVVGTDLSTPARIALQRAAQIAREIDAQVVLVHVVPQFTAVPTGSPVPGAWGTNLGVPSASEGRRALRAAAGLAVEKLETWTERAGVEPDRRHVRIGPAHRSIQNVARAEGAKLIVAGVHRPGSKVETFFLGTTAERLVRGDTAPVLLARRAVKGPYADVLVPLDLTDVGLRVLAAAEEFAPRARYHVVHFAGVADPDDALRTSRLGELERALEALVKAARVPRARCTLEVVEAEPRAGILRLARKKGADLIALGTRGRKGVERLLLGSVADYALRAAPVDVLAVPPAR